jgi:transglutaminase-like putative cysteine protease
MDCKKKATLVGAWLKRRGIPFRLVSSSRRKDRRITHVFPQAKLRGKWVNLDATYSAYYPAQPKKLTNWEMLPRGEDEFPLRGIAKPDRSLWRRDV